ncbi:MAG TPA: S8 family serine peptidase [Verrucomicrobiae bacterium]|jgi:subtilisin-like proprotein convertase family protein
MSLKPRGWFVISLALFAAGGWMWHYAEKVRLNQEHSETTTPSSSTPAHPALINAVGTNASAGRKSYHLSNTRQTAKQLLRSDHAIILRNALIDTTRPLHLDIPPQLRTKGPAGSYIVQFDRPLDREFYQAVKKDGGEFVSYIPNNAGLVKADAEQAKALEADPTFQAVLPYEPYYKLDGSLLPGAVEGESQTNLLSVTTFPGQRDAALAALTDLGAKLVGEDSGPFGPSLVVSAPPDSVAAIAQLPLAQEVETYARRRMLNDISRVQLGVTADTLTNTPDYLNLSGSNVVVSLNDTGVDSTHKDFTGAGASIRLKGAAGALEDDDGHGTHVAGIIIGNGSQSSKVTNQVPGSVVGADFRGKATNATLYVQNLDLITGPFVSDNQLQINASSNLGPTNLISNNSWGYSSQSYDIHAASYDAATRDAQPMLKGDQPLLFVFASGDGGNGTDSGVDGQGGTINSPGSAKNVITVGATDTPRFLTNLVSFDGQSTNQVFLGETDNSNLVTYFSGVGNVGLGVEGITGRFKPDVVAPGVFIVSARSHNYVDPTNETLVTDDAVTNQSVAPGKTNYYPILYQNDGSALIIQIVTNSGSPAGYTNGFIVRADGKNPPVTIRGTDILGANVVILTNQIVPGPIYVGVAAAKGVVQPVTYDLHIFMLETNSSGDYFQVLSNMNSILKPAYRYESGTSMSAAAVSGVLALMQDFLEHRLNITPSPALLKALLINGSRSIGLEYDFDVKTLGANEQGWGMPFLPNSIPSSFTNGASARSLAFFDQSPANALATGQYQNYIITDPSGKASNAPIRISLVWTDPPGDPAAGVALVNQLSLTVTDHTGTNVFIGNDFLGGDIFSEANTGNAPDAVNNVQNIYIDPAFTPLTYPLTVTVGGARVNVNAVTARTNIIGQDYALVISGDDPTVPLSVVSNSVLSVPPTALVTQVSSGVPLLHERVGANQPTLWNFVTGGTNGSLTQWHFFVFTNLSLYTNANGTATNVAFATFLPPNLSAPRNTQSDIDMYVSTNPKLLQLDKLAVLQAFKSVGRGGTETFVTNSLAKTWYIGIKSEDQQAADFGFYAVAQQAPFSVQNPNGSVTATGTALPVFIPDAAAGAPAFVFAFLIDPLNPAMRIQDVTVSLGIQHGNPSDLYGTLTHNGVSTVLNHNSGAPGGFSVTYDDLQEQASSGDALSDGPGSLKNFIGQAGQGLWMLTEADNALGQTGEVETFSVTGTPQPQGLGFTITLQPNSWYKGYVPIPNDATNLTIFTTYASQGGGPIGIYLTNFDDVNFSDYTTNKINPPGGSLSLSTNPPKPFPPLSGGNWYYGIYNFNDTTPVTLNVLIQIQESLTPDLVQTFSNNTATPLLTAGHTQSQICITSGQQVVDLSVGLRISDTNLDDLSIHLTSPQGTSVLLFENRGGLAAQNLGLGSRADSNLIYTVFTEDTSLTQTPVKFASKFASPAPSAAVITADGFEGSAVNTYTVGQVVGGTWKVESNQVGVVKDATLAHTGNNFLALTTGRITNTYPTIVGKKYELIYWARGPGILGWWPGDRNTTDIAGGHNGTLVNGASYADGEVGSAFNFDGSGQYVKIADSTAFRAPSVTIECWFDGAIAVQEGNLFSKTLGSSYFDSYQMWLTEGNLNGIICNIAGIGPELSYPLTPVPGVWYYAAYTFDNDSKTQALYLNGAKVLGGAANLTIGYDSNPVFIGTEMDDFTPVQKFDGKIDEDTLYGRALSPVEIQTIYSAGSAGKYNSISLLPNFVVQLDGYSTNTEILANFSGPWQAFTNSFIATNNQVVVEFSGNTMSTLFDDIQFTQLPETNFNNYFLPEEPLTPFIGENPQGCWTLDVWDTRTDSPLPSDGSLLSWDLQTTISSTNVSLIVLSNDVLYTSGFVAGDSVTYFAVDVPPTASFATNILSKGSHPLNLLFDQDALPTGGLPGDVTMISGLKAGTFGTNTLAAQGPPPPLLPGRRYFLAVQNSGPKQATFNLEVQFDVSTNASVVRALTNQMSVATNISGGSVEYYSVKVPGNTTLATFQILGASTPLSLFARAGLPVPGPLSYDYTSSVTGAADQFVVVTTNSTPLALPTPTTNNPAPAGPTTWYLAVYNNTAGAANYTILATVATNGPSGAPGALDVMQLKPGFVKTGIAQPGFTTNIIYALTVLNNPAGVQFTLANKSAVGGLQLLAELGAIPTPGHSYDANSTTTTSPLSIVVGKGAALPSVNGTWYLAIANTASTPISYTITGTALTTGPVTTTPFIVDDQTATTQPLFIGSRISSPSSGFSLYWTATQGKKYNIEVSTDLVNWSVVTTVVAESNTAAFTDSIPVSQEPGRFFRITTQ